MKLPCLCLQIILKEQRRIKSFRNVHSPSGKYILPNEACSNDHFESGNSNARFQDS